MSEREIYEAWSKLPEGHQNDIAGNFFPELLTDVPEAILRSISIAIANAEDVVQVDGGTLSLAEPGQRQTEREGVLTRRRRFTSTRFS